MADYSAVGLRPARRLSNLIWMRLPNWNVQVEQVVAANGGTAFKVFAERADGGSRFNATLPGDELDVWELADVAVAQMRAMLHPMDM